MVFTNQNTNRTASAHHDNNGEPTRTQHLTLSQGGEGESAEEGVRVAAAKFEFSDSQFEVKIYLELSAVGPMGFFVRQRGKRRVGGTQPKHFWGSDSEQRLSRVFSSSCGIMVLKSQGFLNSGQLPDPGVSSPDLSEY